MISQDDIWKVSKVLAEESILEDSEAIDEEILPNLKDYGLRGSMLKDMESMSDDMMGYEN